MGWQDDLAAKVAAMTEDDWDKDWYVVPSSAYESRGDIMESIRLASRDFDVDVAIPFGTDHAAFRLIGTVNDRPIGGAGIGCLMVRAFRTQRGASTVMSVTLRRRSWNLFFGRDGVPREYRDADGKLPFEPADLSLIP